MKNRILCFVLCCLMLLPVAACTKVEEQFKNDPFDVSTGMRGSSKEVDPGSTLKTWDLARAADYKADDECSDEELLEKWLAVEGLTTSDLDKRGCKQLVMAQLIKGHNCITNTVCYEKDLLGRWKPAKGFSRMIGHTGDNGISHDRIQGDMTSPAGLWQLGPCFGNESMPEGLKMPWKDITPNSDWVGDNDSLYYNSWQEKDDPDLEDTWDGEEHLEDYRSAYALSCVIRFNMYPYTRRYKGSAIFFHVGSGGTAGCISLRYNDLKNVFLWLDPDKKPYILITGYEK